MQRVLCKLVMAAMLLPYARQLTAETVIRGRNEGTLTIPASNVMGSGNITAFADVAVGYGDGGVGFDPAVGGQIGIGGILQFSVQIIPYSIHTGGLGPVEGHLQATFPRNDKLRFFGLALRADLYLSTSLDTISENTDRTKPEYNPHLLPSMIIDFDILAKVKKLPLKAYLFGSMADDPQLLHRYDQISGALGLEWKSLRHSIFGDVGLSFYKEKASRITAVADQTYEQMYVWVRPGARVRFLRRFSAVAAARVALFQKVKSKNPFTPDIVGIALRLEAPLYFRETDTEAIRTLVFMEQRKERTPRTPREEEGDSFYRDLDLSLGGFEDSTETFDYSRETEALIRRRQEIQKRMEEIEELFENLDEE